MSESARLRRERETLVALYHVYCRREHGVALGGLCGDCRRLLDYSLVRLKNCPHKDDKPTCAKCTVHCYDKSVLQDVKTVMRKAGPWMMLYHPYLALMHLCDGLYRKGAERFRKKK